VNTITGDKPFVVDNPHDAHVWTKHEHEQREAWAYLKKRSDELGIERFESGLNKWQDALSPPPTPRIEPAPFTETLAPVASSASDTPEPEWHLMATAEQLCAAFGTFTGMNKDWFANPKDKPALKAARFQPGQGGRNKREPLFYVYPVLQWMLNKRRKTGRQMQEATGWRMLKQHFPKVYEANELSAPDPD
jgi:hypothetical protein